MDFKDEIFKENLEKGGETSLHLKNDTERKSFLDTYKKWPVLAQINELCLRIHQFKLKNNTSILAFVVWDAPYERVAFQIFSRVKKDFYYYNLGHLRLDFDSKNTVIKYLKDYRMEI